MHDWLIFKVFSRSCVSICFRLFVCKLIRSRYPFIENKTAEIVFAVCVIYCP